MYGQKLLNNIRSVDKSKECNIEWLNSNASTYRTEANDNDIIFDSKQLLMSDY